jgi:REP element-mobilizing transposase RayT
MPGDSRGHVSKIFRPGFGYEPKQNIPGTPYSAGDAATQSRARALQKHETVWLTQAQAECVAQALVKAALERAWQIPRAAIMSNHVHAVVIDCPDDGPAVRRILKGTSQAALSNLAGTPCRWWTQGGSDRYKHGDNAIDAANEYVAQQFGKLAEIIATKVVVLGENK